MINLLIIGVVIFLKFALPAAIVFFPFGAGWANFVLDSVDGDILIPAGMTDENYQPIDKIADWCTYIAMAWCAWRFRWRIRKWIYGLLAFRSIGQAAFLLTGDGKWFFFFPNFLEPLFLVYATVIFFKKRDEAAAFAHFVKHKIAFIAGIFLYKMQDEYITHIANLDRTDFFLNLISKFLN